MFNITQHYIPKFNFCLIVLIKCFSLRFYINSIAFSTNTYTMYNLCFKDKLLNHASRGSFSNLYIYIYMMTFNFHIEFFRFLIFKSYIDFALEQSVNLKLQDDLTCFRF